MKDEFYGFPIFPHIFTIIMSITTLAIIIVGVIVEEYAILFALVAPLFMLLIYIFLRKQIFSKICISECGIARIYKNEILKEITWADLIEVKSLKNRNNIILFLDQPLSEKEIANNYAHNIMFYLSKKNVGILWKYKDKFKDKIASYDSWNKKYADLLK